MSTIGGVFTKPDGTKVFVKPMLSEVDAIAEKRATEIARKAHGLISPKQTIRTMIDPTDIDEPDVKKKRKIIVLESPFDPRFDPNTMPKTFTERDYIKQLVASSLRADKDLKRGNLGGNVIADVGAAGVFDSASGTRSYSAGLPSMESIAMHNLKGVPGPNAYNSPFWFGNATADIPQSIQSAEDYERKIKDEINRTLPKLRKTIDGFKLADGDPAKKVYEDMYRRLESGLNEDWKKVYNHHRAILIKPDELIENTKTGELRKPKTTQKPQGVSSSSNKPADTRKAPELKANERVVQKPKPRRGPKGTILPGYADAPHINISEQDLARTAPRGIKRLVDPAGAVVAGAKSSIAEAKAVGSTIGTTLSQSAAAASRTALYGTGPIDPEAKAVRRRLQKIEREEAKQQKKTQARAAASKTALYGGGAGSVTPFEKSLRRKGYTSSQIAEQVGYQQKIISEKAAASAAAQNPTRRAALKAKAQAGAAKFKGKGGGVTAGLGIAAGATMIGSMAPGKVGEISQKLMMPLMGLSMVLPMLKSPMSAVAIGLLATVGSIAALRMAFDKAANEVIEQGEKFKASTSAINSIAKFGGKVTASEQMDLKRKNSFNMTPSATGKTTYGEAFVQTEEGKGITSRLAKQNAAGKSGQAVGDLSSQLTTSVMSGAMDINQAKSLAMNVARQAGDVSMGIRVIAQMEKILGPNGEDLEKNPLKVRTDMVTANRKKMQSNIDDIKNANPITKLAGQKTMQIAGVGASALGGAAAGAGIGTFIGGPIGAAIGGGIGAAVGAAFGYFQSKKYTKQAAVLGAAYAVDAKIAMEQNKQMLDSMDMSYEKKLAELKLQGKMNEARELEIKYLGKKGELGERDRLTAAQGALQADVVSQYNSAGGLQESMMSGMKKAVTAKYKNDPNQLAYLDVVNQQAGDLRSAGLIDSGQEFLIQAKMASGDIPPAVFRSLLGLAADNKEIAPKMMNIITKFSGATSESIGVAAQNILDSKGVVNKTVQTKFVTKVEAFERDSDALDFTKNMIKLNNLNAVIPSDVLVSYYVDPKNKEQYEKLNTMLDSIEGSKDLTAQVVYDIIPNIKGTAAFDEAYFNTLTEDQQKTYTQTIASIINIPDPEIVATQDFIDWQKSPTTMIQGKAYGGADYASLPIATQVAHYKEDQGFKAVTEGVAVDTKAPTGTTPTGGGSKVQSSPLDDLVKKLRDVRKNQIKVTEGWSASRKALDGLFGGKKTLDAFSGIENDIRKIGGSEDLISLIVGMDPKEYEDKKKSLFKFDNKGNIIGLKNDAKNIQEALNSIAMGDFNSKTEAETNVIEDQGIAFAKLASLGMPVADAYAMVENAGLAQAIAMEKNSKSVATLANNYKVLTKAQLKQAAVKGITTDIDQFKKDAKQAARISKTYSSSTATAINSDENLMAMENAIATQQATVNSLRNKGADKEVINTAQAELNKLITDFDTRLAQLKSTVGFMQDMFNDGFSNAMEAFDVQETALNVKFKLDTKSQDDIMKQAQEDIALIQYKVDDKEAALKAIEDQEQKINEKYDERIKALDEVEKANAAISNQQRGQLTLAEALTSGDIAAAAKAAQDMRAQQAADAVTKQKDAVEQSRQYELNGVTGLDKTDGQLKTRKQLEQEIKNLQDQVFKIEEDKIEPAQEFVRLKQIQLDKDIAGLTVLGNTRDAWEKIKHEVDLAMINSNKFIESMKLALATVPDLKAAFAAEQTVGNDPILGSAYTPPVSAKVVGAPASETKPATATATVTKVSVVKPPVVKPPVVNKPAPSNFNYGQNNAPTFKPAAVPPSRTTPQGILNKLKAIKLMSSGGMVPKYFAAGGFARGTDTVPAMLTPGEFIMSKYAVDSYGVDNLKKINNGDATGGAVYNNTYTLTVNAKTDANPNEIAQAVMSTIKQVEDRRIRGIGINGR
jgi:hypothetical protein